jgi:hypothetical protein
VTVQLQSHFVDAGVCDEMCAGGCAACDDVEYAFGQPCLDCCVAEDQGVSGCGARGSR